MTMPPHPCAGRSRAQREAFEAIAVNQKPNVSPRTIEALLKAGLIVKSGERRVRFGTVPIYEVPLPIHFAWCEWCAAQPDAKP